jgi:DNA-binding response OmpR family regulator
VKRVLVVEDDANILLSLVFLLERDGFQVETVTDGGTAVGKIRAFRPDLIILDVMLPIKNGYEVCHEVQQDPALRHIPTLMLTAKAQEAERRKGLEVGAVEYVTKPFRVADLRAKIHAVLGIAP